MNRVTVGGQRREDTLEGLHDAGGVEGRGQRRANETRYEEWSYSRSPRVLMREKLATVGALRGLVKSGCNTRKGESCKWVKKLDT